MTEQSWIGIIEGAAPALGLPVDLIRCQIAAESGDPKYPGTGDPGAISSAGAIGLMQLEPTTALDMMKQPKIIGRILGNEFVSLTLGMHYDAGPCLAEAKAIGLTGTEAMKGMLAAYNGGPGMLENAYVKLRAAQAGQLVSFTMADLDEYLPEETRNYYRNIWAQFEKLQMPIGGETK